MAQIVKLKRTAVSGKVPTTSNLELGELAMNTYDGRIFFEKDNGTATIQEILTTNPSTYQTGSIVLNGDVTASFFTGDGSNLTFGDTGLISSSTQVNADLVTNFDSNILSYINTLGVNSGSVSGYSDSDNTDHLNSLGVLSGSTHSGNQTFSDNVTISGDLTVDGTTTSVNSTEVNIGDNMIVLNSDETGTPSQDAGIEIERGTSTNVKFQFKESTDRWQFTNDGSTFFNLPTSTSDVAEFGNLYYTDARVKTKLNVEGVISGSSQVTITESQISDLSHYGDSDVVVVLNDNTVISGSSQVVLNDADKTGFDTADVSEHSSNLYYTDARVKTKLNTEGVISGSVVDASNLNGQNAAYYLNYNNFTNIPSGLVSSSYALSLTGSDASKYNVSHGQQIRFTTSTGLVVSVNEGTNEITWSLNEYIGSNSNFQDGVKDKLNTEGVISGSSQITDLTTHKETVSGATSYQIDHNLGEQYPIVQCWSTHTSQQEFPKTVETNSTNRVTVEFYTTFAGVIIVKK